MNLLDRLRLLEFRPWAWVTPLLLCFLLPLGVSRAGDHMPFKATFHGFTTSITSTEDPHIFVVVVQLEGKATHLGRFDERLTHLIDFATLSFTGFAEFTAANGDAFYTRFFGQGFPDPNDADWITFDVTHTVVGGTGRFAGATGDFDGVDGRYNLVTGEDLGGYDGSISSPGANKK